jgi:hypothetical protein
MSKDVRNALLVATQNAAKMKQLELRSMNVIPWDGQYTFTHWIAFRAFKEAAKKAQSFSQVKDDMMEWERVIESFRKTGVPYDIP